MAGEWIWRAFEGRNETLKKGVFLTLQAMAAGMVWFYGRQGEAGAAKRRRRPVYPRGKVSVDMFETPVSSPAKSAKPNPFKTPVKTPSKPLSKPPVKSAARASLQSPLRSVAKSVWKSPLVSALKSPLRSLLLSPGGSLHSATWSAQSAGGEQKGPVRRLFQGEAGEGENEDWWDEETVDAAGSGARCALRYEVDSEDALCASDEEIRRILDDE